MTSSSDTLPPTWSIWRYFTPGNSASSAARTWSATGAAPSPAFSGLPTRIRITWPPEPPEASVTVGSPTSSALSAARYSPTSRCSGNSARISVPPRKSTP